MGSVHVIHPLSPLYAEELKQAAALIRSIWPNDTDLKFKVITLQEPPKQELFHYLAAEHNGGLPSHLDRKAFASYYIRHTVRRTFHSVRPPLTLRKEKFFETVVNLSTGKVETNVGLGPNLHAGADYEEALRMEKEVLEDEGVKKVLAQLNLPKGTIVIAEPWGYGRFEKPNGRSLC